MKSQQICKVNKISVQKVKEPLCCFSSKTLYKIQDCIASPNNHSGTGSLNSNNTTMSEQNTFVVKAVQSYKTKKKGELAFKKNQLIQVTNSNEAEFLYYGHFQGKNGLFIT